MNTQAKKNDTPIDHAKGMDILMPMYILIEYGNSCSKTTGSLWKFYRDELALNDDGAIQNLPSISSSFKSKIKITERIPAAGNRKDVQIVVPLKCLSNFWRTLETLINKCKINLILIYLSTCVINDSNGEEKFAITDKKLMFQL